MKELPQPWAAAMEATIFTGWIYDHLQPHAAELKVAHPLMLRAIALAKKKNDRMDASKRSEEHTSELQSPDHLVCRLLLEKKKKKQSSLNKYTTTEVMHA